MLFFHATSCTAHATPYMLYKTCSIRWTDYRNHVLVLGVQHRRVWQGLQKFILFFHATYRNAHATPYVLYKACSIRQTDYRDHVLVLGRYTTSQNMAVLQKFILFFHATSHNAHAMPYVLYKACSIRRTYSETVSLS